MSDKKRLGLEVEGKNIFVYEPLIEEKTETGIIKSPDMIEKEMEDRDSHALEIAAVGPEVEGFKVGDKVLIYNRHVPIFSVHGTRYIAILESDIVARVYEAPSVIEDAKTVA